MKKTLLTTILLVISTFIFGQVTVSIANLKVNGISIPNGSPIDLARNTSVNVTFRVDLSKPNYLTVGPCKVWISAFNSSGNVTHLRTPLSVPVSEFSTGASANINVDLYASSIDFGSGNYLSATLMQDNTPFTAWESGHISIKKTPTYTITSNSSTVECGSIIPVVFTVSSDAPHFSSQYQWTYGAGWILNSSSTTENTLSLLHNGSSAQLSPVRVTPSFGGVVQPVLTKTITLAPFTSSATISGPTTLCSSATYGISNLLPEQTVSWSIQGRPVATLSTTTGPTTTLTRFGNGTASLTATITNLCGQTFTLPVRTIYIGLLEPPTTITGPTSVQSGALVNYQTSTVSGATSYEWWLPYPYETVEQFDYFGQNWQKLTNAAGSSIQVFTGYAGTAGYIQVMAVNDCGIGGATIISVAHGGSGGAIPRLSNPIKVLNPANAESNIKEKVDVSNAEIMATLLLDTKIYPNPANEVLNIKVNADVSNAEIMATLYDLLGRKILQVEVLDSIASLNVENIPAGNYILKLAYNSVVETHLIIIE